MFSVRIWACALAVTLASATGASAGPFVFSGTDSDDHGSANVSGNQSGWLFMQKALETLAPAVTNGNTVVTILGSTSSAATAANSAFNLSALSGLGWTLEIVPTASFGTFFGAGGGISSSGILMMDSGFNVAGGVDGTAFVPYANQINTFVGDGGGLFSQGNGYDWVIELLPLLEVTDVGGGGIGTPLSLTGAGNAAFPGLTNADLSTGPWHNYFTNFAPIPVLATALQGVDTRAVIIGSDTGSITDPGDPGDPTVPEPATLLLLGGGIAAVIRRRRQTAQADVQ